jgi:hypothetical protein
VSWVGREVHNSWREAALRQRHSGYWRRFPLAILLSFGISSFLNPHPDGRWHWADTIGSAVAYLWCCRSRLFRPSEPEP